MKGRSFVFPEAVVLPTFRALLRPIVSAPGSLNQRNQQRKRGKKKSTREKIERYRKSRQEMLEDVPSES